MGGELYDPAQRDSHYQGNVAQYLVDLHVANACFNFCGGMMFQGRVIFNALSIFSCDQGASKYYLQSPQKRYAKHS